MSRPPSMGAGSTMKRISSELDEYLEGLSEQLTLEMGRTISVTEASRLLAASQPRPLILRKRGGEVRVGRSLISL